MPTYKAPLSKIFLHAFDSFCSWGSGQEQGGDSMIDGVIHRQVPVTKEPLYSLSMPIFNGWELMVEKLEIWAKRMGNGSSIRFGGTCPSGLVASKPTVADLESGKGSTMNIRESTK
ncbi:predicted protein [Histoplasma capsulatum var. duboisii H88]|uniref:Predicted protein n=1 Tax=Ajellomyces capsulatus (strain H88) TaxID=544711 RepID=F0UAU4_AJEC8|nr:predicted protein [Histoplasma capsulatum var. duboisii H88]